MTLTLYNTLTRKKAPFQPLHPNKVGLYVCGVTVWDSTHIGHARSATVFDVLVRYLRQHGHAVTFVRNFTDVDDKIINRANAEGVPWHVIAERYIAEYRRDMQALGNAAPDHEPFASAYIPQMIVTIEALIAKGLAYVVGGDVFYAVRCFPGYGQLSGKRIEELEVGARVDPNEAKRDPLDFALWKGAKPGEPAWPSPWGPGRPGWHIECSAMSVEFLGQPFDIHGGGQDLIFPHHENEIAQSEGARGCAVARYWLHNGMVDIDRQKMSKSLGNIFKTSEALQQYDVETLRYFLLSAQYRSSLDFTVQAIADAAQALERFYAATARLGGGAGVVETSPVPANDAEQTIVAVLQALPSRVERSLDDDLNTPRLFGVVFDAVRELNRYLDQATATGGIHPWVQGQWSAVRAVLHAFTGVFGSAPEVYEARLQQRAVAARQVDLTEVERLIAERTTARGTKDFARADAIRQQLAALGVELKDRPGGGTDWWVKAPD
ncbi:MAG: cysteine--tRNA ligase [Deltaproteobacteria bacterium]|nr:cysteine--tRNA ligase [Deltaproteobacteria bacterium]